MSVKDMKQMKEYYKANNTFDYYNLFFSENKQPTESLEFNLIKSALIFSLKQSDALNVARIMCVCCIKNYSIVFFLKQIDMNRKQMKIVEASYHLVFFMKEKYFKLAIPRDTSSNLITFFNSPYTAFEPS